MSGGRSRVVIAGAGVAGLEGLLALHHLAPDRVDVTLIAPTSVFVYRPLLVAEPFGLTRPTVIDLHPLIEETGANHVCEALTSVNAPGSTVTATGASTLEYDALLVAVGARPVDAVPGALSFAGEDERGRFGAMLGELGRRGVKRVVFVVPRRATWSIAAYELALLTARERDVRRLSGVELTIATHEPAPLELFGAPASQLVAARLAEAGIELRSACVAERFEDGQLRLADGEPIAADRAVALPGLSVPEIPGVPQSEDGFVTTDVKMHVTGLERVWGAGDVTRFPIKQGGLAAQQADVAARSIAAHAGAHVPAQPFQPVLRAALITGGAPEYMRAPLSGGVAGETTAGRQLWQPAEKLAGHYLAPYLSLQLTGERSGERLVDVTAADATAGDALDPDEAMALLLGTADADARAGDFEGALRWLSLAERLEFTLPQEYVTRRHDWLREIDPSVEPGAAAARIDPSLVDAEAAVSDLHRRIGWLREIEARTGSEMQADLSHLDRAIEQLTARLRQAGILSRRRPRHR